jgi:hypothetical protein
MNSIGGNFDFRMEIRPFHSGREAVIRKHVNLRGGIQIKPIPAR